jgi:hypothetical protein
MNELINILKTRSDLAIVAFLDGCCSVAGNLQPFFNAMNAIRPSSWASMSLGSYDASTYTAYLNTASLYASTFANAGLSQFNAGAYTPINSVPQDYALYTLSVLPASPPATVNNVIGFFMPQAASNNGQGACVFLTSDASAFDPGMTATQYSSIAKAFTSAALDPNGACKQPVSNVPDLSARLTQVDGPIVGIPSNMSLTVTNSGLPGVVASSDGTVAVTLPTGLALINPPSGCTATATGTTTTGFTCPVAALQPGGDTTFNFQVLASAPLTNVAAVTTVSGVTGEVNTGDNTFTLSGISTTGGTPDLSVALTGLTDLAVRTPSTVTLTVSNSDQLGVIASEEG